ncbi:MAG: hypothetical protein QG646_2856 [Euryarchaeota archaeon]|nr:hypothetical protein [Euryarchaeota archaeon]
MVTKNLVKEAGNKGALQIKRRTTTPVKETGAKKIIPVKKECECVCAIKEVGNAAICQIEDILEKKAHEIVSVFRIGENWDVKLEILERKSVPDTQDILGIYEMKLDPNLNVMEYRRIGMRHKGDMIIPEEF